MLLDKCGIEGVGHLFSDNRFIIICAKHFVIAIAFNYFNRTFDLFRKLNH